jgi:hypothetical protein
MATQRVTIADILGKDVRTVHRVRWPGTDKDVGLLMLRCSEIAAAYFDAREWFRRKGLEAIEDSSTLLALQQEYDLQLCYRALVDPEAKIADARLFKDAADARSRLDVKERVHFASLHGEKLDEREESWTPAPPPTPSTGPSTKDEEG